MAGMTVSLLGDGVFLIALTWQVYLLSNAPSALSFVGIAAYATAAAAEAAATVWAATPVGDSATSPINA